MTSDDLQMTLDDRGWWSLVKVGSGALLNGWSCEWMEGLS